VMKAVMKSDDFGEVKRVNSDFSFYGGENFMANNIRGTTTGPALEPLGSLGDLGWYNARLSMFVFDWALPESVSAVAHASKDGMPIDISCTLNFGAGKSSVWTNSYDAAFRQYAAITGTRQTIELTDFCLSGDTPDGKGSSTSCSFRVVRKSGLNQNDMLPESEAVEEKVNYTANQEVRMWETFAQLCKSPDDQEVKFYADVSLNTQRIMDAIMASVANEGSSVLLSSKRKASEV